MFTTKMKASPRYILPVSLLLLPLGGGVQAADSFTEALTGGKANLDLRVRYEAVEEDNASKDASALTARTRLGYTTADFNGFNAMFEFENVTAPVDDYNSGLNSKTQYSTVVDPEGSEVNQAFIGYSGLEKTVAKFGRQRVILDNARFVGNVGWRQNEQTFDGLTIANTSIDKLTVVYGYVTDVNTIRFGDLDVTAHLLNVAYQLPVGKLTGYSYMIENEDDVAASNKTLGLRFSGDTKLSDDAKLLYTAEVAQQSDYQDGVNFDADYMHLIIGADVSGISANLGYEVLGSDGTHKAFDTPIATKHAFNGWADKFLSATPANGLTDLYVSVGGMFAGVKLLAVYHDFSADNGSADYGTEIDLLAAKKFSDNYSALIKYANYSADAHSVDTTKLWVAGEVKF